MKEKWSEKVVQRVNELYHDFTGHLFDQIHPEIFQQEVSRLQRVAERSLCFSHPVTVLEIGTGTGFVPATISRMFKESDVFICSDISSAMLRLAQQNLQNVQSRYHVTFRFVKLESGVPFQLPFASSIMDAVVTNSVLHHVEDTDTFLTEAARVLKPGGLLLISHEPNRYFQENFFLRYNYRVLSWLATPTDNIRKCLKQVKPLEDLVRPVYHKLSPRAKEAYAEGAAIADKMNAILLSEHITQRPLAFGEILDIVDIKVPIGFKPDALVSGFKLVHLETYNHISWVSMKRYNSAVIRRYDRMLSRRFPKAGATFLVLYEKV